MTRYRLVAAPLLTFDSLTEAMIVSLILNISPEWEACQ